jgi:hypothetical protein
LLGTREQGVFAFLVARVGQAALHRAHCLARLVIEESDALAAASWIYQVLAIALTDGVVGALWFASAAIDAFVGNVGSHVAPFQDMNVSVVPLILKVVSVLIGHRKVNDDDAI